MQVGRRCSKARDCGKRALRECGRLGEAPSWKLACELAEET